MNGDHTPDTETVPISPRPKAPNLGLRIVLFRAAGTLQSP
jgi:hypothetical protein